MLCKIKELLKDKKYAKPIIVSLLVVALFMLYKKNNSILEEQSSAIPIEIAAAKISNFPVYITALGTVTPDNTAILKTQVNGQLVKLTFKDGEKVKKGDLLARIDQRSYEAQLLQYEGQLKKDQAILENSQIDLKRYQDLWKQNAVSKQVLDTQIALVKQNEGIVQLDQGLVDTAKVNISYCNITAPFDGQVGISAVTEGSIVQTTDQNGIVVVNSLDPISVIFSIPEIEIANIVTEANKLALKVEAYDQAFQKLLKTGTLQAIDNQIDPSTGTVNLKASFDNKDGILFPNQFVNIKLFIRDIENAITIPTPAVQYGPEGNFVYLLNKDKTKVQVQPVIVDITNGDLTVIKNGLLENQVIAVTGVDKLKDKALVSISGSNL